jgi:hypothetical protein
MARPWFKVWTNEWLDGTTRFQMTGAQRAFWMDLIAQAARSRYPGVICSGRDGENFVGYPLTTFSALDPGGELDILATFELFVSTGKIVLEVTAEKPVKLYKVTIINWGKYQSEYLRQKSYRQKNKQVTARVTPKVTSLDTKRLPVEVEVEGEVEVEKTLRPNSSSSDGQVSKSTSQKSPSPEGFDNFWSLYPRKEAKQSARKAWRKVKPDELPAILAGLRVAMQTEQWQKDGGQFVPLPATWLNGRRWEDEISITKQAPRSMLQRRSEHLNGEDARPYLPPMPPIPCTPKQ